MKKKNYVSPKMEVVNIRAQQPLLVGSAGTSIQSMDEEYLIEEN